MGLLAPSGGGKMEYNWTMVMRALGKCISSEMA